MSRLPNAPLIEVIFELRWDVRMKQDMINMQYLYGDLYNALKDKYPIREHVAPPELPMEVLINLVAHRYRSVLNGYPLYQLGAGVLTLNSDHQHYDWENYYPWADELLTKFFEEFLDKDKPFKTNLSFIDFFPVDFEQRDVNEFINESFNIKIEQTFFKSRTPPINLNLGFYYKTEVGDLAITFQKGIGAGQKPGIIVETKISGNELPPVKQAILDWLGSSHKLSSQVFKDLINERFYMTFS